MHINKYAIAIYNPSKALFVLFLSILSFNLYNLSNIFAFIKPDNINVNIAIYTGVYSILIAIFEIYIMDNATKVEATLSTQKSDRNNIPRTLVLKGDNPKNVYLILKSSGNLKRLNSGIIKIVFPIGVTVSRGDNIGLDNQEENEININLSELMDAPGYTVYTINVLKSTQTINQTKIISCKLHDKSWELISFSSNELGIEIES